VRRRRHAFTLIEMLVVIGVILILMSLAVIGYQVVEKAAAANQTKTTLNNLNAMLSELDAAEGSTALPTYGPATGGIGAAITGWTVGDVSGQGAVTDRTGIIVSQTALAVASLLRVANNQKAFSQLPSSKVMTFSNGTVTSGSVLLDGWDNPIIYVPSGGIWVDVTTGGSSPTLVLITSRDKRPFFASAGPDGDFGAVSATSPTAGDDDVYSREQ
jgi:prepilin-type N-terminal cleavage/methylation domain-containing protein